MVLVVQGVTGSLELDMSKSSKIKFQFLPHGTELTLLRSC